MLAGLNAHFEESARQMVAMSASEFCPNNKSIDKKKKKKRKAPLYATKPVLTRSKANEIAETDCPICTEHIDECDVELWAGCRHAFHRHCIGKWTATEKNAKCPMCRRPRAYVARKRRSVSLPAGWWIRITSLENTNSAERETCTEITASFADDAHGKLMEDWVDASDDVLRASEARLYNTPIDAVEDDEVDRSAAGFAEAFMHHSKNVSVEQDVRHVVDDASRIVVQTTLRDSVTKENTLRYHEHDLAARESIIGCGRCMKLVDPDKAFDVSQGVPGESCVSCGEHFVEWPRVWCIAARTPLPSSSPR